MAPTFLVCVFEVIVVLYEFLRRLCDLNLDVQDLKTHVIPVGYFATCPLAKQIEMSLDKYPDGVDHNRFRPDLLKRISSGSPSSLTNLVKNSLETLTSWAVSDSSITTARN